MGLFLVLLSTKYSNSQDISTTGNLTNFTNQATGTTSTWQNAGTIGQQLTCWEPGGQGYCGPLPRVAAWGPGSNVINFSYGLTDLNQIVNIKNALPNSGTGLQVNGFNFSFTAKNGNGWDDGRQDVLSAYVNIYNNTNSKVLEAYNYDLNRRYGWTQFSYSETFKSAYGVPDLGNAQYGFVGKDNNFWVGPYGPEIIDVNFNLKYSVDPCATNPLYSPTCKGYTDALAKLSPTPVAVADAPPPPESTPPESVPLGSPPPGSPVQADAPVAGPPPPPGSPGPGNNTGGAPSANQPPLPSGGQQPRPGETKTANDNKAGPSLSNVMSMISSNQTRIGNEAKSVVQAAESAAAKDAQQAQAQAETVAGALTTQSIASSVSLANESQSTAGKTSAQTQTSALLLSAGAQNTATSVEAIRPPTQVTATDTAQTINTSPTISNTVGSYNSSVLQFTSAPTTIDSPLTSTGFQLPSGRTLSIYEIELPPNEGIKMGTRSTLNDVLDQQPTMMQSVTQSQQTSTVKRDVQINDLAVGVDIASIARQPVGYQAYSMMMPDVAFYAPREIYRNQVNVDNVRLLRGLGSDKLHQDLVNLQYK